MATSRPTRPGRSDSQIEPIAEIHRRVVRIHASMAEATDDDPEIRRWGMSQLMELARYIESVRSASQLSGERA